jgi:hypothetical protein
MVRTLVILIIPLAAACGRRGFDEHADAPVVVVVGEDAPDAPPPVDAPPAVLACGAQARFVITPATKQLAAASTRHGYDVFTVDSSGKVQGFSYAFDEATDKLTKGTDDVSIASGATGPVSAYALDDDVLVAVPYANPGPGTALIALDTRLGTRGAPVMYDGTTGGTLARNSNGTLAFLTQPSLKQIDVRLISPAGADLATRSVQLIDGTTEMNDPTIIAAGTSFLVTWNADISPSEVHAQLFDEQLVARTPVKNFRSDKVLGTIAPHAAYAAAADRYLFSWHQKDSLDEVWVSLRDGSLDEIPNGRFKVSDGQYSAIAAGDKDFLVVWQDGGSNPYHLDASRVDMNGMPTAVGVAATGATAGWDLVVHAGQPALVRAEAGTAGPNLWLDPLCPP